MSHVRITPNRTNTQDGVELPPLLPTTMPSQPVALVEPKDRVFSVLSHDTLDDFVQAEHECTVVLFYDQSGGYMSPESTSWRNLRKRHPTIK